METEENLQIYLFSYISLSPAHYSLIIQGRVVQMCSSYAKFYFCGGFNARALGKT